MRRIIITLVISTMVVVMIQCASPSATAGDRFSNTWHDGKAEVNGYRLTVNRYGQERAGEAVLIYVTEPVSESHRVKVNDMNRPGSDHVDVLKLNLVRDFQTGIYDYNTMTSVFVRTDDLEPLKISFSSAEWCGHVFENLHIDKREISGTTLSYFEGESTSIELDRPRNGLTEDELFIRLRSLRGDFVAAGGEITIPLLPSAYARRLQHRPAAWTEATIRRLSAPQEVTVPAGTFTADVYGISIADGRRGRFDIETEWPHRLLRWSLDPDVEAVLTGSVRIEYWRLNGQGQKNHRQELGLGPWPMAPNEQAE